MKILVFPWILVLTCSGVVDPEAPSEKLILVAKRYLQEVGSAWASTGSFDEERHRDLIEELRRSGEAGVHAVARFIHDTDNPASPCELAVALAVVGKQTPGLVVELLLDAMPMQERSADQCLAGGMVRLGPSAYGSLLDCAKTQAVKRSFWCLASLLAQSYEVDSLRKELGINDRDRPWEPPTRQKDIRRVARVWADWWEHNQHSLSWDPEDRVLRTK